MRRMLCVLVMLLAIATAVEAAIVTGVIKDSTGAPLAGTRVVLRSVATGQETVVSTTADGTFRFEPPAVGTYLVIASRRGFSEGADTVVVERADQTIEIPMVLSLGTLTTEIGVTATRGERALGQIPLHVETVSSSSLALSNPLSTGDALAGVANVTPVGGGPFGVRPRLRGLDSTRVLVLVDGERLNTARMATERTGAEVGLLPPGTIDRIEIVNGAGTLMYGSDALAGTINIVTAEPAFTPRTELTYGFNGFYSSNEDGLRGSVNLGASSSRFAFRVQAGSERFGAYRAGNLDLEDTTPFFSSGQLSRADTIDDNFGFSFGAFPDPFNAPYVRTDALIPNSGARGRFVTAAGLLRVSDRQSVRVRYQRSRMTDVGFPDFAQPYFFNATSLPYSNLDKISARYEARALTPRIANLSATVYYQRTARLLENLLPVQFPAPTAGAFFPVNVMRLDILSQTEQRVWTPGVDLRAVITPASSHLLTTGLTVYRDRSADRRTTETTTSLVGQVALGPRGPAPIVFPAPMALGPATVSHPVRVPDASLRDLAVYAQHEWRVRPNVAIVGGLRGDFYAVDVDATPAYDVASIVAGAEPAIDPATLPSPDGARFSRRALTGDLGVTANPDGRLSPFIRIGRSYRHPNLEEMLFAGPATVGNLAPNIAVKPEKGVNFDAGARFRAGLVTGGAYVFVNRFENFIAQDFAVASTPAGPLAQATNFADVRISGLELSAVAPIATRHGVFTASASAALTRGTIVEGVDPATQVSLSGTPADNITPARVIASLRFTEAGGRWWAEYGLRAQPRVRRVAATLLDSPFLIAQDLLSLQGFQVHRLGGGVILTEGRHRAAIVFAVENLADRFYREHFQFAPSRGRTVTIGLTLGAF